MVDNGIDNLSLGAGQAFTFVIPKDAFQASTGDVQLAFQVSQTSGAPLPSWVQFNPETGTFSGQVPEGEKGDLSIRVKAVDSKGNEAVTTFTIRSGAITQENAEPPQKPRALAPLSGKGLLAALGIPASGFAADPGVPPAGMAALPAESSAAADDGEEFLFAAVEVADHAPQLSVQLQREAQRYSHAREATLRHLVAIEQARQSA